MILDSLEHIHLYKDVWPNLSDAVLFSQKVGMKEPGRYDFRDSFVLVQDVETEPASEKNFEAHRKYLDVHIVLSGLEVFEYEHITKLKEVCAYDEEKDLQMFEGEGQSFTLMPGMFCVVFAHDAHKPACCKNGSNKIRKVVVKVPIN